MSAQTKVLDDATKTKLGYQEDADTVEEDKATTLANRDYSSLFNTGKTEKPTERVPSNIPSTGGKTPVSGSVLDQVIQAGGVQKNDDNIIQSNSVQNKPKVITGDIVGDGDGDGTEFTGGKEPVDINSIPIVENPPVQNIIDEEDKDGGNTGSYEDQKKYIQESIANASGQLTATGMGAEAPTGFKYSWQKNAEDISLNKYLEDLRTANANALSNALQLERSRQDYLAANEMAAYTRRQTADKMGWASGKPQSEDRQLAYMKATIAASLYSATELQRAGYESSLAQARYQYENNLVQASLEQYKLAVDDAYKQAQLTGIYISPEVREMNANYNIAANIVNNPDAYSQEEYNKAVNIYNTIIDWYASNGVSSKGITNVAYFLDLQAQLEANFHAELQNYLNQFQIEWAKGDLDGDGISNYDEDMNIDLQTKEWELKNQENLYYSSLHKMFEEKYGKNHYIAPYYTTDEEGKTKPTIEYGEIKMLNLASATPKDLLEFFEASDNNKNCIKGFLTSIVDEANISYTSSLPTNNGTITSGTDSASILAGINSRLNNTYITKILQMMKETEDAELKKEIEDFLNDVKVVATVGDNSCILQFDATTGKFTQERTTTPSTPDKPGEGDGEENTTKIYGDLASAIKSQELQTYLTSVIPQFMASMPQWVAKPGGDGEFKNEVTPESRLNYIQSVIDEYKKITGITTFSYDIENISKALNWYHNEIKWGTGDKNIDKAILNVETKRIINEVLKDDEEDVIELFNLNNSNSGSLIEDDTKTKDVIQKLYQWSQLTNVGKLNKTIKILWNHLIDKNTEISIINIQKDWGTKPWLKDGVLGQKHAKLENDGDLTFKSKAAKYIEKLKEDTENGNIPIGAMVNFNYNTGRMIAGIYLGNGTFIVANDTSTDYNFMSNYLYVPDGYEKHGVMVNIEE